MSLQDDWLTYVQDSNAFDKHHFEPLITDTDDPVDLEAAFGDLPNGAELIRRIRQVRKDNDFTGLYHIPKPENKLSRPEMQPLARRYTDSLAQRLASLRQQDFARMALENPTEFIGCREFDRLSAERSLALSDIDMTIGDDYIDFLLNWPRYVWGLHEAVLFMTKFPEVTRYVLNAMVEYPVQEEYAYRLWKGGAFVSICEQQTLIVILDE